MFYELIPQIVLRTCAVPLKGAARNRELDLTFFHSRLWLNFVHVSDDFEFALRHDHLTSIHPALSANMTIFGDRMVALSSKLRQEEEALQRLPLVQRSSSGIGGLRYLRREHTDQLLRLQQS